MPIYCFINDKTQEIIEVVQKMTDKHVFSKDGVEWRRVFVNPNISMDTQVQSHSEKDFIKSTENKKMSVGDLWDKSAELSEKRAQKDGVDSLKENSMKEYEKKTKKKHPARKTKIETKDYIIEA